jgi:hypothetical protein
MDFSTELKARIYLSAVHTPLLSTDGKILVVTQPLTEQRVFIVVHPLSSFFFRTAGPFWKLDIFLNA